MSGQGGPRTSSRSKAGIETQLAGQGYVKPEPAGNLPVLLNKPVQTTGRPKEVRLVCQIAGCGQSLINSKGYFKRFKLCEVHLKAPAISIDGMPSRLCQQCGRFHELAAFEGNKRTCTVKLERIRESKSAKRGGNGSAHAGSGLICGLSREASSPLDPGLLGGSSSSPSQSPPTQSQGGSSQQAPTNEDMAFDFASIFDDTAPDAQHHRVSSDTYNVADASMLHPQLQSIDLGTESSCLCVHSSGIASRSALPLVPASASRLSSVTPPAKSMPSPEDARALLLQQHQHAASASNAWAGASSDPYGTAVLRPVMNSALASGDSQLARNNVARGTSSTSSMVPALEVQQKQTLPQQPNSFIQLQPPSAGVPGPQQAPMPVNRQALALPPARTDARPESGPLPLQGAAAAIAQLEASLGCRTIPQPLMGGMAAARAGHQQQQPAALRPTVDDKLSATIDGMLEELQRSADVQSHTAAPFFCNLLQAGSGSLQALPSGGYGASGCQPPAPVMAPQHQARSFAGMPGGSVPTNSANRSTSWRTSSGDSVGLDVSYARLGANAPVDQQQRHQQPHMQQPLPAQRSARLSSRASSLQVPSLETRDRSLPHLEHHHLQPRMSHQGAQQPLMDLEVLSAHPAPQHMPTPPSSHAVDSFKGASRGAVAPTTYSATASPVLGQQQQRPPVGMATGAGAALVPGPGYGTSSCGPMVIDEAAATMFAEFNSELMPYGASIEPPVPVPLMRMPSPTSMLLDGMIADSYDDYVPSHELSRLMVKIFGAEVDDLPPDLLLNLEEWAATNASAHVLQGCLRQGCVEVVFDMVHVGQRRPASAAAVLSAALGMASTPAQAGGAAARGGRPHSASALAAAGVLSGWLGSRFAASHSMVMEIDGVVLVCPAGGSPKLLPWEEAASDPVGDEEEHGGALGGPVDGAVSLDSVGALRHGFVVPLQSQLVSTTSRQDAISWGTAVSRSSGAAPSMTGITGEEGSMEAPGSIVSSDLPSILPPRPLVDVAGLTAAEASPRQRPQIDSCTCAAATLGATLELKVSGLHLDQQGLRVRARLGGQEVTLLAMQAAPDADTGLPQLSLLLQPRSSGLMVVEAQQGKLLGDWWPVVVVPERAMAAAAEINALAAATEARLRAQAAGAGAAAGGLVPGITPAGLRAFLVDLGQMMDLHNKLTASNCSNSASRTPFVADRSSSGFVDGSSGAPALACEQASPNAGSRRTLAELSADGPHCLTATSRCGAAGSTPGASASAAPPPSQDSRATVTDAARTWLVSGPMRAVAERLLREKAISLLRFCRARGMAKTCRLLMEQIQVLTPPAATPTASSGPCSSSAPHTHGTNASAALSEPEAEAQLRLCHEISGPQRPSTERGAPKASSAAVATVVAAGTASAEAEARVDEGAPPAPKPEVDIITQALRRLTPNRRDRSQGSSAAGSEEASGSHTPAGHNAGGRAAVVEGPLHSVSQKQVGAGGPSSVVPAKTSQRSCSASGVGSGPSSGAAAPGPRSKASSGGVASGHAAAAAAAGPAPGIIKVQPSLMSSSTLLGPATGLGTATGTCASTWSWAASDHASISTAGQSLYGNAAAGGASSYGVGGGASSYGVGGGASTYGPAGAGCPSRPEAHRVTRSSKPQACEVTAPPLRAPASSPSEAARATAKLAAAAAAAGIKLPRQGSPTSADSSHAGRSRRGSQSSSVQASSSPPVHAHQHHHHSHHGHHRQAKPAGGGTGTSPVGWLQRVLRSLSCAAPSAVEGK